MKETEQRNDNHLKLLKGKASASPGLHVVLASLALHDGAKRSRGRAGEDRSTSEDKSTKLWFKDKPA